MKALKVLPGLTVAVLAMLAVAASPAQAAPPAGYDVLCVTPTGPGGKPITEICVFYPL